MNPTQPLPGTTPPPAPSPSGGGNDQWPIYVAIGCAMLGLCCLCGVGVSGLLYFLSNEGGGGGGLGLGQPTRVHVTATVTSYLGLTAGISPGTTCDLPITQETTQDGRTVCHVLASCGGQTLYGDAQTGFFPCQFSTSPPTVIGQDTDTTMGDQDGAFSIDTNARTLSIADDFQGRYGMYVLSASITGVTAE